VQSSQITTNTATHFLFYMTDSFPVAKPTVSKHWRHEKCNNTSTNGKNDTKRGSYHSQCTEIKRLCLLLLIPHINKHALISADKVAIWGCVRCRQNRLIDRLISQPINQSIKWFISDNKGQTDRQLQESKCRTYSKGNESVAVGLRRWLMRLTIQLNNRPYNALAMASLTPAVSDGLLCRTIVSPRAIIPDVVRDSFSSSAFTPSKLDTNGRLHETLLETLNCILQYNMIT